MCVCACVSICVYIDVCIYIFSLPLNLGVVDTLGGQNRVLQRSYTETKPATLHHDGGTDVGSTSNGSMDDNN